MNSTHYITFPSGLRFAPSAKLVVNSLFNPGGTDAGHYKRIKNGIQFFIGNEPRLFLVANKYGERFFVTCSRQSDGRIRYAYSTSAIEEKSFGLPERFLAKRELAESIFESIERSA